MSRAARLIAFACLSCAGCALFNSGSSSDGGSSTGAYGFNGPTLELTVNGAHAGPSALTSGAADLTSARDSVSGTLSETTLHVSAAASGAGCELVFQRFGDRVTPFHAGGAYQVITPTAGGTADGTVAANPGESVSAMGAGFQCSGSDCDGAVLQIVALAADHVEGSFSGTLVDASGQAAASVTCSFWVPTRTFQP